MIPLSSLFRMPAPRLLLLAQVGWELWRAAWQVRRWPFARIARSLGGLRPVDDWPAWLPSKAYEAAGPRLQVPDLRWAVAAWARHWPHPPSCLMQALAARRVLNRWGLHSRLYFGVKGTPAPGSTATGEMAAHAWLCCGDMVVTGAGEAATHQPIAVAVSASPEPLSAP